MARFRYRWASCSHVKPMPPSTWMQSFAAVANASGTTAPATAAASACSVPSSASRAASQAAARACSSESRRSAQRCLTAWNWPMGRPNCSRTFA